MSGPITDSLLRLCAFFDLGPLLRVDDAGGYANRNLVLETGKGLFLAKALREHGPAGLRSEALYLERVAAAGFPSPAYLTGRNGDYLFAEEGQFTALRPFLAGEVSDTEISPARIESLGAALARLHLLDANALPPRRTWWQTGFLADGLVRAKRRFGGQALVRLEKEIGGLTDLEGEALPRSIVHGDPWSGNAVFDGEDLAALIDWEETTLGFPLFDLAYLALQGCLSGQEFDRRKFEALIAAYQSVRELSLRERHCFTQAVHRVACTTYLWLLLKEAPDQGDVETLWASTWYRGLELDRLTL